MSPDQITDGFCWSEGSWPIILLSAQSASRAQSRRNTFMSPKLAPASPRFSQPPGRSLRYAMQSPTTIGFLTVRQAVDCWNYSARFAPVARKLTRSTLKTCRRCPKTARAVAERPPRIGYPCRYSTFSKCQLNAVHFVHFWRPTRLEPTTFSRCYPQMRPYGKQSSVKNLRTTAIDRTLSRLTSSNNVSLSVVLVLLVT